MKHSLKRSTSNVSRIKHLREGSRIAELLLQFDIHLGTWLYMAAKPTAVFMDGVDGIQAKVERSARRARQQNLRRMKELELIKLKIVEGEYRARLTDKGAQELFRLRIMQADLFEDDRVCMVVFDVPEQASSFRKNLRHFLSTAGFIPIQKSVWISPFDAGRLLAEMFQGKGRGWIRVYTAKRETGSV